MDPSPEHEQPETGPARVNFVLLHDPGPYPLAPGAELNLSEVHYGLRLGSFYPGTELLDQSTGQVHRVVLRRRRQVLNPPCERLRRFRRRMYREPDGDP